jgi:hypothetical protein
MPTAFPFPFILFIIPDAARDFYRILDIQFGVGRVSGHPKSMPACAGIRLTTLAFLQIVSGDLCAGNVLPPPVRKLVAVTIPFVSEPPGNFEEFQAHAAFLPMR